jgi:Cu-Zn family superoxide dismutase
MEGVAVFNGKLKGFVVFTQMKDFVTIEVAIQNNNMKKEILRKNAFHIHASGDLRRGCDSCCKHYNPGSKNHGGLNDKDSHAGDLGNIVFNKDKVCNMTLFTSKFKVKDIIGRSLIVHEKEDDLGKGGNEDSLKTGNSGARKCCEIIGIAENKVC